MTESSRSGRARLWLSRALQVAVVAIVLWFALRALAGQWDKFREHAAELRPNWLGVLGSALLVLLTYAVLVESWRVLVRVWGDRLRYADAARIWAVSNLGRYLPGRVWSIGVMSVLAREAGASPTAAAGSAILSTLLNIAAGFVVLFLCGADIVDALVPGVGRLARVLPVLGVAALVVLPLALPTGVRLAARVTRQPYVSVRIPARVLALVAAANVGSWLLYGVAFRVFAGALQPNLAGKWVLYTAVFAGSYLAGYLALVVPGGLGVRELSMATALVRAGGTDPATAAVLAVGSRLWLTVLELLPGLVFLALRAVRAKPRPPQHDPA